MKKCYMYLRSAYKKALFISASSIIQSLVGERLIKKDSYSFIFKSRDAVFGLLLIGKKNNLLKLHVQKVAYPPYFQLTNRDIYWNNKKISKIENLIDAISSIHILKKRQANRLRKDLANSFRHIVASSKRSRISKKPTRRLRYKPEVFEQLSISGHIRYPFPKLRPDFTQRDTYRYGNESREKVTLPVFVIPIFRAAFSSVKFSSFQDFSSVHLKDMSTQTPNTLLLPVHPWQLEKSFIKRLIKDGQVEVSKNQIDAYPLASLRTLFDPKHKLHLKLSLSAQITSERRIIYQHIAQNAPILSSLIEMVVKKRGIPHFDIQRSICSVRYKNFILGPHLSCIFRESFPRESEIYPCTYLFENILEKERSPICKKIDLFSNQPDNTAVHFFKQYVDVLISGPLLLLDHGIGTEPHLQNSLMSFTKNGPDKLILRDIDGININVSRVVDENPYVQKLTPGLYPQTKGVMHSEMFSVIRLFHSMILSHAALLVHIMHNQYGVDIKTLWDIIHSSVRDTIQCSVYSHRASQVSKYFLENEVQMKCLLKMRLENTEKLITRKISNPLYANRENIWL